jgi:hypothetical protein
MIAARKSSAASSVALAIYIFSSLTSSFSCLTVLPAI